MALEQPYRVLARAYRPKTLKELIGQEALVKGLKNSIETNRIAHAYLFSGIRGTGKTTAARILARALNCTGPDGNGLPTPEPCGQCPSCLAILENRSLDVIEMDAATHTGIGDIREIIEGISYAPVQGRYKIYIIDEVHMLSIQAFNGLLKTLEEPPSHVKFIFATTEIRKIPVTVLSRCLRFELKRIEHDVLFEHLCSISKSEGVEYDDDAIALIANAGGGSARDGLSLLDQAIAIAEEGRITAQNVRLMLGLAETGDLFDLFDHLLSGDINKTIEAFRALHDKGADPASMVQDLLELNHELSCLLVNLPSGKFHIQQDRLAPFKEKASLETLARDWQMLLKGLADVKEANNAKVAAEMVLIRLCCASHLPPPGELARLLRASDDNPADHQPQAEQHPAQKKTAELEQSFIPQTFSELTRMLASMQEQVLAQSLVNNARLLHYEPGLIELRVDEGLKIDLVGQLRSILNQNTDLSWTVKSASSGGGKTLKEQNNEIRQQKIQKAEQDPDIQKLLKRFPGSKVVDVR